MKFHEHMEKTTQLLNIFSYSNKYMYYWYPQSKLCIYNILPYTKINI